MTAIAGNPVRPNLVEFMGNEDDFIGFSDPYYWEYEDFLFEERRCREESLNLLLKAEAYRALYEIGQVLVGDGTKELNTRERRMLLDMPAWMLIAHYRGSLGQDYDSRASSRQVCRIALRAYRKVAFREVVSDVRRGDTRPGVGPATFSMLKRLVTFCRVV